MIETLKAVAKSRLNPSSWGYNGLAWVYGFVARRPGAMRAASMRLRKDSRFGEDELDQAGSLQSSVVDLLFERFAPKSFLDVGCGVGRTLQYVHTVKRIDALGLEGSEAARKASPVPHLIRLVNLNQAVQLGRQFDLIWSVEVAEHIHPDFTNVFLDSLAAHGSRVLLSAARPGQGGAGHFNEQPASYWIERMRSRGFTLNESLTRAITNLPDLFSENMMLFERR